MNDPGAKRDRRRAGLCLAAIAAVIIVTPAFGSSPASADPGYDYLASVGAGPQLSGPTDIAVDNSSGPSAHDLYVADSGHARVIKVAPDGGFILMFGDEVDATTGGDVCTAASGDVCQPGAFSPWELPEGDPSPGFSSVGYVAVDGSNGPSAGDVYVTDQAHERVLKFDPSGHRITGWGDEGELQFKWIVGIAVDSSGRLMLLEGSSPGLVRAFDAGGSEVSSSETGANMWMDGLGVDTAGNVFAVAGQFEIEEFGIDGTRLRSFQTPRPLQGFAVDASNGDVFVSQGSDGVSRFLGNCAGSPCSAAATFGEGRVWAGSPAIDEGDRTLYTLDYGGGQGPRIAVFLPSGLIPDVRTGAALAFGEERADLEGEIDPDGASAASECHFEYVTQSAFIASGFAEAVSAPCSEPPPFSAPTMVSALLSGLHRGTVYRYRLVARTGGRSAVGPTRSFVTPIVPKATTGAAREVGGHAATLTGSVVSPAGRIIIKCVFEYAEDRQFRAEGFSGAGSVPCAPAPFYPDELPVEVEARPGFLRAGTTYHYRVTAINTDATVPGATHEFTTQPDPVVAPPEPEPPEREPHVRNHSVRCSQSACSHLLTASTKAQTWISPKFPRTYGWILTIYSRGNPLHHTALEKNCMSTFTGNGLIARLNACRGRFRLVYRGTDRLRVHWRVFEHCRCADNREMKRFLPLRRP